MSLTSIGLSDELHAHVVVHNGPGRASVLQPVADGLTLATRRLQPAP